MNPKSYNPCADGYVAKCWECLRRNQSFKEWFNNIVETKEPEQRYVEIHAAEYEAGKSGNYLARLIFSGYRNWKLNKCWRVQPKVDRTAFAALFSKGSKLDLNEEATFSGAEPAAYQLTRFNLDDIYLETSSGNRQLDADKAITALNELKAVWSHYDLIAVPKTIRHDKHRKKILADIDAQIPKSLFRAITLKNEGRWLGTETDWDIYNLYEGWIKSAYSEKEAQQLTAHEYNGEDFGTTKKQRRERASSFLKKAGSQTFTGKNKRNPETRDAIKIIKDSIASVFPKFEPYCPPGKRNKATLNSKRSD